MMNGDFLLYSTVHWQRLRTISVPGIISFFLWLVAFSYTSAQENVELDLPQQESTEPMLSQPEQEIAVLQEELAEIKQLYAVLSSKFDALEKLDHSEAPDTDSPLPVALLAALAGAACGGLIGHLSSRSVLSETHKRSEEVRRKADTIIICTEWIGRTKDIAAVLCALQEPKGLDENDNFNRMVSYGNWLELVQAMRARDFLDEGFLKEFKLSDRIREFRDALLTAAQSRSDLQPYIESWKLVVQVQ